MQNILEGVLAEFGSIAAIPRPSKHEQAVGQYLSERLTKLGLEVQRDPIGNVIAELTPSIGCENAPRVILQAHMDMVCVADEGIEFNPLTDPIKLRNDGEYLTAEGTSLGADDGIGISIIIFILKNFVENPELKHGAIRVIFTVDEESGMSGAAALDKSFLNDASFLINCDSENCEELVIGSAGSVHIDFHRRILQSKPSNANAFRLSIGGLRGGHSGEEINSGRANAIKLLGELLSVIDENGGRIEISAIEGGKAVNAIADQSKVDIVTAFDAEHLQPIVEHFLDGVKKKFRATDPGIAIKSAPIELPNSVLENSCEIIALLKELKHGVFAMQTAELVETSANLGIVSIDDSKLTVRYFPRSSRNEKLLAIVDDCNSIAERLHFDIETSEPSTAWTENRNSPLARLTLEVFAKQNSRPMLVKTIHAGLECSYFFDKNPALDIISIGTTNEHIHSPRERLNLSTVAVQVNLLAEVLARLTENV